MPNTFDFIARGSRPLSSISLVPNHPLASCAFAFPHSINEPWKDFESATKSSLGCMGYSAATIWITGNQIPKGYQASRGVLEKSSFMEGWRKIFRPGNTLSTSTITQSYTRSLRRTACCHWIERHPHFTETVASRKGSKAPLAYSRDYSQRLKVSLLRTSYDETVCGDVSHVLLFLLRNLSLS